MKCEQHKFVHSKKLHLKGGIEKQRIAELICQKIHSY